MALIDARGQVSAPFKLLIAVIVFAMVLILLTSIAMQLQRQACQQETLSELDELVEKLESVSRTKSQADIEFNLKPCGAQPHVFLTREVNPSLCAAYCSTQSTVCTLLHYEAEGMPPIIKCVNISPLTVFASAPAEGCCPDRSDEALVLEDWDELEITQGDFLLASVAAEQPTLCAYRETIETGFKPEQEELFLPAIISAVFSPDIMISTFTFLDSLGFWLYLILVPLSAAAAYFSFERLSVFFGGKARAMSARRKELALKLAASSLLFVAPLIMAALTRLYWGIFLALLELLIVFAGFYWLKRFKKEKEFKAVKVKDFGGIKTIDLGKSFGEFKPPKL